MFWLSVIPTPSLSAPIFTSRATCTFWRVALSFVIIAFFGIKVSRFISSPRIKPPFHTRLPEALVRVVTRVLPESKVIQKFGLFARESVLPPVHSRMMPLPERTDGAELLQNAVKMLLPVCDMVLTVFPRIIGTLDPVRVHATLVRAY